jgi:proteasome lid subunit RPN8/RPN11
VIVSLLLSEDLRTQIAREANDALPRECCGLIEGYSEGAQIVATALHPARNIAIDDGRFEIDPARYIALLRKLRGTDRAIVGCYHSHPNGRAEPSVRDREVAANEGFLWLIQGTELRGFVWTGADFADVVLLDPALA